MQKCRQESELGYVWMEYIEYLWHMQHTSVVIGVLVVFLRDDLGVFSDMLEIVFCLIPVLFRFNFNASISELRSRQDE